MVVPNPVHPFIQDAHFKRAIQQILSVKGTTDDRCTTVWPAYSVIDQMTQAITTVGGKVEVRFDAVSLITEPPPITPLEWMMILQEIRRDGTRLCGGRWYYHFSDPVIITISFSASMGWLDDPPAGNHTYDVRWAVLPDGCEAQNLPVTSHHGYYRILTLKEFASDL